jgi:DNA polymerase III delta prime subunit
MPSSPKFDVFLSHSRKDADVADRVCVALERSGLSVWIAPRNVLPSESWADAIVEGIASSRLVLVIFSEHANHSKHVARELECAVARDRPVLPLRIEDVLPTGSMEYFLSGHQWLDALPGPIETHLTEILAVMQRVLAGDERGIFQEVEISQALPRAARTARPAGERPLRLLRQRVRQFWIEGVLKDSVAARPVVLLQKQTDPTAVERLWDRVLEVPGQEATSITADTSVMTLFERAGGSMLILGEPGSGKTTTLLELTRELIARSEQDESAPIPVVFKLSTWSASRGRLLDWLEKEMNSKYLVGTEAARRWLKDARVMPLLDGLDEVHPAARQACVTAINTFQEEFGPIEIAVASRLRDYMALPVRLRCNGAIRLERLTDDQVDAYINGAVPPLRALRAALDGDAQLRQLAGSPLMLNVMSYAYDGASEEESAVVENSVEGRRRHLFDRYVDRMFKQVGASVAERRKMITSLSWVAAQMQEHSTSILLVEHLQPSWLPSLWERLLYLATTRLIVLVLLAYGLAAVGGSSADRQQVGGPGWLADTAVAVVLLAMILAVECVAYWRPLKTKGTLAILRRTAIIFLAYYSLSAACMQAGSLMTYGHAQGFHTLFVSDRSTDPLGVFSAPWQIAVALWGGFGIRSTTRSLRDDIRTGRRLRLRPSWRSIRFGLALGGVAGAVLSLSWTTVSLINAQASGLTPRTAVMVAGVVVVFCGMLGVMASLVLGQLEEDVSPGRVRVNEGTRQAVIVGLYRALVTVGLSLLTVTVVTSGRPSSADVLSATAFGLLVGALFGGGLDAVFHYVLRLLFWMRGHAWLRFPAQLDKAERLVFLRRVGGGYLFFHGLFLEHLRTKSLDPS